MREELAKKWIMGGVSLCPKCEHMNAKFFRTNFRISKEEQSELRDACVLCAEEECRWHKNEKRMQNSLGNYNTSRMKRAHDVCLKSIKRVALFFKIRANI